MNNSAYETLLYLLSRQNYSEYKLKRKLKQKEFSSSEIEDAITKAKEKNYFQEENYTKSKIRTLMRRGESFNLIKNKLSHENISVNNATIDEVASDAQIDQFSILQIIVEKKLRGKNFEDLQPKEQTKIVNHLLRKGHRYEEIKKVIKHLPQLNHNLES